MRATPVLLVLLWLPACAGRCGAPPPVSPGELSVLRAAQVTVGDGQYRRRCDDVKMLPKQASYEGIFQICVHPRGFVYEVSVDRTTGDAEVDAFVIEMVRRWRYEPLVRAGEAIPFCHGMHFSSSFERGPRPLY